jgi:hypothetical protein
LKLRRRTIEAPVVSGGAPLKLGSLLLAALADSFAALAAHH